MDAERLETWKGGLPAVFTLAAQEVTTLVPPRSYCMCLPRQSLLPFVTQRVHQHFEPFGPPMGGELWFEHAGTPLRWQVPIGVLFDLLCGEEAICTESLPWQITVHFQQFPANQVLHATPHEAESVLINALKESCYLRCGTSSPVMALSKASQNELVASLANSANPAAAFAQFAPVHQSIEQAVRTFTSNELRAVPVRTFTSLTEWRQQPVPPTLPSTGVSTTLRDA
jgi:autophagy-related protein 5